ncbi:MAG: TonB-dependent receptor [Pseudomonadales bacterium]|nr:TonB-dependent receptor [Pseudomonadales bacterium]MCP5214878.1 TonB-dependent receptor [Pseudomonadales bacterium]
MPWHGRSTLVLCFMLLLLQLSWSWSTLGLASTAISLLEAVESLRAKGYRIIYSSELVTSDIPVELEKISITTLQAILPAHGLALKRMGNLWVITRDSSQRRLLSGYLVSAEGEAIANADIVSEVSGLSSTSLVGGYFEIEVASLAEQLAISADGFQTRLVKAQRLDGNPVVMLDNNWIESVIVTGSRYRLPGDDSLMSAIALSADEMNYVPALGGDSLRIITHLPGISSVGVSAKPPIRGGLQDEVLILLDGVELLEPFHLADFHSIFSTIDGRTIESIDFYTGGFPARYGNRMSGVMDVSTAMPIVETRTELGVSVFSSFINTRGYSERFMPMDWLVSARRSNLADISNTTASDLGTPRYADAFARVGMVLNDDTELYLGAFIVKDNVTLIDDEEKATSSIDTYHIWSRLQTRHSDTLSSALVLAYLFSERDQTQFVAPEDSGVGMDDPSVPMFLDYQQEIERLSIRNDYRIDLDKHLVEFGLQAEYGWAEYRYAGAVERGVIGQLFGQDEQSFRQVELNPNGWSGGAYLTAQLKVSPKLTIQPGIRWDYQDYYFNGAAENTSPRIGVLYEINEELSVRASIGRFYQPEGLHELQVLDGLENYFRPQRSDQLITNIEWHPNDEFQLKAEVFFKGYRAQKTRYENLFNTFALQPHMERDRIAVKPERALVKGLELSANFNLSDSLSGQLRFSYLNAEDKIEGQWVPRRWSQRHTINTGLTWQRGSLILSSNLTWHTGWWGSSLPAAIPVGTQLSLASVLNNTELRNYFSLDLSLRKSWQLTNAEITLSVDITNVFGRNNIAGVEYDVEEVDGKYLFTRNEKKLLPLAPSLGIMIAF